MDLMMITLGIIFDKLGELNPDVLKEILNTPLNTGSIHIMLKDNQVILDCYNASDFKDQEDCLVISTPNSIEYLMNSKFL